MADARVFHVGDILSNELPSGKSYRVGIDIAEDERMGSKTPPFSRGMIPLEAQLDGNETPLFHGLDNKKCSDYNFSRD